MRIGLIEVRNFRRLIATGIDIGCAPPKGQRGKAKEQRKKTQRAKEAAQTEKQRGVGPRHVHEIALLQY